MEVEFFRRFVQEMEQDGGVSAAPKLSLPMTAQDLRDGLEALHKRHDFERGMIVRQKKSARAYRDLGQHGLSIVAEVFERPMTPDVTNLGDGTFLHQVTMMIADRTPAGDLVLNAVDGRRYEPVPANELVWETTNTL